MECEENQADDHEICGGRLCTNRCTTVRIIPTCPTLSLSLARLTISTHHHNMDIDGELATANLSKPKPLTCDDEDLLGLLTGRGRHTPCNPSVFGLSAGNEHTGETDREASGQRDTVSSELHSVPRIKRWLVRESHPYTHPLPSGCAFHPINTRKSPMLTLGDADIE